MKQGFFMIMVCLVFALGCDDTDLRLAAEAGLDALKAVTLSDADVSALAAEASRASDRKHTVALETSSYARRLSRLTGGQRSADGHVFHFRVYETSQVNAFAMADGTIRIYSGLMDMLDDDELMFVIGHEMGHVIRKHVKKKIMLAYAGSALRKGVASQNNLAGEIARSGIGGIAEALFNAQFSQQEEREADDYGVGFLMQEQRDPGAAVSALHKLAALGDNHSFLSSHPAPSKRAARLKNQSAEPDTRQAASWFGQAVRWLQELFR